MGGRGGVLAFKQFFLVLVVAVVVRSKGGGSDSNLGFASDIVSSSINFQIEIRE